MILQSCGKWTVLGTPAKVLFNKTVLFDKVYQIWNCRIARPNVIALEQLKPDLGPFTETRIPKKQTAIKPERRGGKHQMLLLQSCRKWTVLGIPTKGLIIIYSKK